jgi:hypothetical protein
MRTASYEILAQTPNQLEAQAALFGDHVMWLKFVFTDDGANANKQGIKRDEFPNIVKTGRLKPFKKAVGSFGDGHDGALPIGVIADLTEVENRIEGVAAIWEREFPDDAEQIRLAYASGEPMNISWELYYQDEEIDDKGVSWLKGVATRAATMVNVPAYAGRTPILALAAKWTVKYMNDLPDSAFLYVESGGSKDSDGKTVPRSLRHFPYKDAEGNIDLPHLRNALARIPQASIPEDVKARLTKKAQRILSGQKDNKGESSMELEELQTAFNTKVAELDEARASLEEMRDQLKELETLRAFKEQVEAERERKSRLDTRFSSIAQAGIQMTRDEFETEADYWLGMDDNAFTFVIKKLVNSRPATETVASVTVPPVTADPEEDNSDPLSIMKEFLNERKSKEK